MSFEKSSELSPTLKLILGALFGLALGCFVGATYLITLPVKEVVEMPDEVKPGYHYVLKGRTGGGDSWKLKAIDFQQGKEEVVFLETDLNRWASSFSTEYPDEKPTLYLEPQKPIFRLDEDKLLASTQADGGFGSWTRIVTISMEGTVAESEDSYEVIPNKLYVGSLRLPNLVKNLVWNRIAAGYKMDEEFQSLWSSIETANVHESQLILTAKK
ncbi:MAG: hypothetical protein O3C43_09530 [Verrucomicrobia bacterium]|nr:hypothetical protein [Verrucomicrobiota bacterium]MDA1066730.1 hypothetical protein [Verrucomicrobiota bacterium]